MSQSIPEYVWVVSTGHGYYAESVWTTEKAAWEEARRIGVEHEGNDRAVKRWKVNTPRQIWPGLEDEEN